MIDRDSQPFELVDDDLIAVDPGADGALDDGRQTDRSLGDYAPVAEARRAQAGAAEGRRTAPMGATDGAPDSEARRTSPMATADAATAAPEFLDVETRVDTPPEIDDDDPSARRPTMRPLAGPPRRTLPMGSVAAPDDLAETSEDPSAIPDDGRALSGKPGGAPLPPELAPFQRSHRLLDVVDEPLSPELAAARAAVPPEPLPSVAVPRAAVPPPKQVPPAIIAGRNRARSQGVGPPPPPGSRAATATPPAGIRPVASPTGAPAGAPPGAAIPAGAMPRAASPTGSPPGATPRAASPTGATPRAASPTGSPPGATPRAASPTGSPPGATPRAASPTGSPLGATPVRPLGPGVSGSRPLAPGQSGTRPIAAAAAQAPTGSRPVPLSAMGQGADGRPSESGFSDEVTDERPSIITPMPGPAATLAAEADFADDDALDVEVTGVHDPQEIRERRPRQTDQDLALPQAFSRPFAETLRSLGPDGSTIEAPLAIFSALPDDALADLGRQMILRHYAPGDIVLREGDLGEACYVVASGEVRVLKRDPTVEGSDLIEVARLADGALFGEFALLADRRRHATVQAIVGTDVYEIPRRLLRELAATYAEVGPILEAFYRERLLATLMATAPFFQPLPEERRADLLARFRPLRSESGEQIIREGERAGGFYLILLGSVEITKRMPDRRSVLLATLGEGAYFGEMSLLRGDAANASVISAGPSELAVLPPRDFYEVVATNPRLWTEIQAEAERRQLQLNQILTGDTHVV